MKELKEALNGLGWDDKLVEHFTNVEPNTLDFQQSYEVTTNFVDNSTIIVSDFSGYYSTIICNSWRFQISQLCMLPHVFRATLL
jgi:hypothetical protein